MLQRHAGEGETIAEAIRDCLDYGKDPEKTESGKYISAYECDPATVADEFLLAKASYAAMTGREQKKENDVLCYQIRQSFYPGEITPKEANRIGYELAMRWTKGRHAFIVTTHTDKQHIHCHIYYNSTTLDCTRKFRNFWGSSFALRRLSDRLCLENGLSIVENPKPRSKGKYRNYGEWQKERKGPLSYQDRLRLAIDTALAERPADLDEFLTLMKRTGYEVKTVRGGGISFRLTGQGQERFTRLRASTLGDGYDLQEVLSAIEGKEKRPGRSERKISLAVDIQAKLAAGKGPGYERWAKVFNIKQMAAALAYIQDNGLTDYEQLAKKATEAADRFHVISEQVKQTEQAMKTNAGLKAATVQYAKTRPVFEQYKATKYSRKFLAEHEADLELYRAAQAEMRSLLGGAKLPKMDVLKEEGRKLTAKKKQLYEAIEDVLNEEFTKEYRETIGVPRYRQELVRLKKADVIRKNFGDNLAQSTKAMDGAQKKLFAARREYAERFKPCAFQIEVMDNTEYEEERRTLQESELPRYKEKIRAARESAMEQFQNDFLAKLKSSIDQVQDQVHNLNKALRQAQFGTDKYQFRVGPNPDYLDYYNMITADELMEGESGLFALPFQQKYGPLIEKLFSQITMADDTQLNARKQSELQENIVRYTDFRTYLKFDLETTDQNDSKQLLSQTLNMKSGGETQTPFYIAVLASFAQLYRVNDATRFGNTVRLVVFDEAFNKMDSDRITESVLLLRKMGLQAIICTPPDKVSDIMPIADRTLLVDKSGYRMHIIPFGKEMQNEGSTGDPEPSAG